MKPRRGYYDIFVDACAKYSSLVAVRLYEEGYYKTYTYSELYGICEYISQNLLQLKCNNGVIGLISERNVIIPCVIAASHKFCTTFMFVPLESLESVSSNIPFNTIITITQSEEPPPLLVSKLIGRKSDKELSIFDLTINFFNCNATESLDDKNVNPHSYIAMTSGSTGQPKHIQVPIQCLQPNIDDLTKLFTITQHDIIYFSTPLTFDPSMVEILLACLNGASLLIAPENIDILFPKNKTNSITFWQTTPSKFLQYSNKDIENNILSTDTTLKILALGGEPLNGVKRLRELKNSENKTKIFTLYGVTEMSCWACVAELDLSRTLSDKDVPLGNCLSETEVIIKPTKDNDTIGNIILVSKTRNCYIINKTKGVLQQRSLKFVDTGDLGEVRNGTVYYRGRKDDVIKRFGLKINLQMIECTVMQCPRVKTCSCIWLPKPLLLVIYFCSETLTGEELSNFLKCKLDDKHWPDKIIRVENLPTNAHGKMSKTLLSKLFENNEQGLMTADVVQNMILNELESTFGKKLSYPEIQDKAFFSIGGTSFMAVSLCNRLSMINTGFSRLLPQLMSDKCTFSDMLNFAEKEICGEGIKPNKRPKRCHLTKSADKTIASKSAEKSIGQNSVEDVTKWPQFKVLWTFDTGRCVDASPTLFQAGLNLYVTVGSHSGKVVVLNAVSGAVQGCITVESRVEAAVLCSAEPSRRGVVGAYDGTVVCFELDDCRMHWTINVGSMIKSKPVYCNGLVYIAAYDGKIRSIDINTGEIKSCIQMTDQAISANLVIAKGEYVVAGSLSGGVAGLHAPAAAVVWRGAAATPIFASPVLYDSDKYVVFAEVGGEIHCRTVEKGIKIWKYQGAKGNIFSSLYVKQSSLHKWTMTFGCHDSKVYCIEVMNFQPSLKWKSCLGSPVYATPNGLAGRLVLAAATDGTLCALHADSGARAASYTLPFEVFSSPAVYGQYIFVGCRNDHLFSLKFSLN